MNRNGTFGIFYFQHAFLSMSFPAIVWYVLPTSRDYWPSANKCRIIIPASTDGNRTSVVRVARNSFGGRVRCGLVARLIGGRWPCVLTSGSEDGI